MPASRITPFQDLVSDIEALREHLNIDKMLVLASMGQYIGAMLWNLKNTGSVWALSGEYWHCSRGKLVFI